LIHEFHWDAEVVSQRVGEEWERIYDEPWTGNSWREIQVSFLSGATQRAGSRACLDLQGLGINP
jgi:hypothetical protein